MAKKILHICNVNTPETSGWHNIISIAALQEINEDSDTAYLLNIHLKWEGNKPSNNYGFDIANLIRTEKKSKAPIIFYSPIQPAYFEKKSEKEIKYKIIFGRGSAFIDMPFKDAVLTKLIAAIEPLSKAALHDVATMLCDLKGIVIDKLNHDLKFDEDIDKVIGSVTPYLSALQKDSIQLEEYSSKLKKSIADKKENDFDTFKETFIKICKRKLIKQPGFDAEIPEKTNYSILVLDDVKKEIKKLNDSLDDTFTIISRTTATEAIQVLKDDVRNDILAVIADWRLYTDENNTYWQSLQGYEVLDFAAKNGIRALFALTSQDEDIVHDIRNIQGIRFQLYKKQNLQNADQWKLFGNVISEFCSEIYDVISNIPDSDNWKKEDRAIDETEEERLRKKSPERNIFKRFEKGEERIYVSYTSLHAQYLLYLHSPEKQISFDNLDEKADAVWQYLLQVKGKDENYTDVEILREKFGLDTPKDSLLFPVLVLRRVWMALWYSHVDESINLSQEKVSQYSKFIFSIIHNQGNADFQGNKHSAEQTKLCISIVQVRGKKVLPEERSWFKKWGLIE